MPDPDNSSDKKTFWARVTHSVKTYSDVTGRFPPHSLGALFRFTSLLAATERTPTIIARSWQVFRMCNGSFRLSSGCRSTTERSSLAMQLLGLLSASCLCRKVNSAAGGSIFCPVAALRLSYVIAAMAYANLSGLPPVFGLYSAFMSLFVYTIFGTAKDVSLGPTALMSLIVADSFTEVSFLADCKST